MSMPEREDEKDIKWKKPTWVPTEEDVSKMKEMLSARYTLDEIACHFSVGRMTIQRQLTQRGLRTNNSTRRDSAKKKDSAGKVIKNYLCAVCGTTVKADFLGNDFTLCKVHREEHRKKLEAL